MDPVVTSLLQTNDAASASDAAQIRRLSKDALAQLAAVEDEFSALAQKRKALQTSIRRYAIALAPIRLLPTDVLQYIFLSTLPDDRNPVMSPKESPLLVSQVCSIWRQAALTAPRLWSRLHIPLVGQIQAASSIRSFFGHSGGSASQHGESDVNSLMQRRRQMVEQWLMRAGKTDLSISIIDAAAHSRDSYLPLIRFKQPEPQRSVDIVNVLVKYADQLAVLDLGIPPQLAKPILGMSPKRLPRLRDLRLCHPEYYDSAQLNVCTKHAIVSSPHLRSLRIPIPTPVINGMRVQWGNLTNLALTIQYGDWAEDSDLLPEFLSGCQNLVVLSVVISGIGLLSSTVECSLQLHAIQADFCYQTQNDDPDSSDEPVILPRLTTLLWDNGGSGADETLFQRLLLPSLQELKWTITSRVRRSRNPLRGDGSPLTDLLERSGQALRKLELKIVEDTLRLSQYSRLAPGIERLHLELISHSSAHNFWKALSLPIADPTSTHHEGSDDGNSSSFRIRPFNQVRFVDSVFEGANFFMSQPPSQEFIDTPLRTSRTIEPTEGDRAPFPRLAFISCRCGTGNFAPDHLQQFIRSRRDANILTKHGASKLQKFSISLRDRNFSSEPSFATSAKEHREKKQREFVEELTTKFGVDVVEGLEMDIEWPYFASSNPLLSAFSGLPEQDGFGTWVGGRAHQPVGLFPQNSLDLC